MPSQFPGFPKETFSFLKKLKANNNRDWFNGHKDDYETIIREPALDFIRAMEAPLKKISPHFRAVPKKVGGSLMRVYRDTRFSKDKTPYKTNVGIHFKHEMCKDVHAPGFYLHIEVNEVFLGAGIWRPDSPSLKLIRTLIDDDPKRWKRVSRGKKFRQAYEMHGESLKRPPAGFDKDHPMIDDLKMKDHIGVAKLDHADVLGNDVVSNVTQLMKVAKPYVVMLCDSLRLPS